MRSRHLLVGFAALALLAAPAFAEETDAGTPDAGASPDAGPSPTPADSAVPNAPADAEGRAASASPDTAPPPAAPAQPPADQAGAALPAAPEAAPERSEAPSAPTASTPSTEPSPVATPPAPAAASTAPGEDKAAPAPSAEEQAAPIEPAPAPPVVVAPPPPPRLTSRPRPPPPPAPSNDLSFELGWNAPAGWGVRYLHHFDGTNWSAGAGLALLTLWGPKVALIARRADDYLEGAYFQASYAASGGKDDVDVNVVTPSGVEKAVFTETPGRTLDLVYGYRWNLGSSFLEAFGGWSFNLRGTGLQKTSVALDDATRGDFNLRSPGGIAFGGTWGRLF